MSEIIKLNDIKEKRDRLESLNIEFIELVEKLEEAKKKFQDIDSLYLFLFGELLHRRLKLSIKVKYLKSKLRLIVASVNKGEKIDLEKVDRILNIKLENYYKDLNKLNEKIQDLYNEEDYTIVTKEEMTEIKKVFKFIAKKLHPDLNKNLTESEKNMWNLSLKAYENNDLVVLLGIKFKIEDKKRNINIEKSKVEELGLKIEKIKERIEKLYKTFPLNIEDKIKDSEFIKEEKEEIKEDIDFLENKIEILNMEIKKYLEMI